MGQNPIPFSSPKCAPGCLRAATPKWGEQPELLLTHCSSPIAPRKQKSVARLGRGLPQPTLRGEGEAITGRAGVEAVAKLMAQSIGGAETNRCRDQLNG